MQSAMSEIIPPSSRPTTSAASTRPRSTRWSRTTSAAPSSPISKRQADRRLARHAHVVAGARRRVHRGRAPPGLRRRRLRHDGDRHDVLRGVRDGLDGGAQITASHNPKQYNGIKMVRAGALPLSGDEGIGEIRDMVVEQDAAAGRRRAWAARRRRHVLDDYVEHILKFVDRRSSSRSTSCSTPAAAWAAWSRRSSSSACPAGRRAWRSRSTARSRITRPIRSSRRTAAPSPSACSPRRPTSASRGTATPTACFFIDGTGEFVAGDFVTALLAEAFLIK